MPPRNLHLILLAVLVSLFCHATFRNTRTASIVGEAIELIDHNYVDTVDRNELVMAAMQGIVDQLDDHSSYFAIDQYANFQDSISQEFAGIGIYVEQPVAGKPVRVLTPLVGSPALAAGMLPNDLIVNVDNVDVSSMPLADVSSRLKGTPGTTVDLTVRRASESDASAEESGANEIGADERTSEPRFKEISMTVTRATIELESVVGDHRDVSNRWVYRLKSSPDVAYVRLKSFGEKTVRELREVLSELNNDFDSLVIDLRGNGGGLLYAARDVCDMLLERGGIVSTRTRGNVIEEAYSATPGTLIQMDKPVAVLIDENSASASEIVAACLQDNGRALVAGVRSYGKGTVQEVIPLQYSRSALRLTVARYFRPNNKNIHRQSDAKDEDEWGVTPDEGFVVPMDTPALIKLNQVWQRASFPLLTNVPEKQETAETVPSETVDQESQIETESEPRDVVPMDSQPPLRQTAPLTDQARENIEKGPEELSVDPPLRAAVGWLRRQNRDARPGPAQSVTAEKLPKAG